jgi:hypothetical protein
MFSEVFFTGLYSSLIGFLIAIGALSAISPNAEKLK